jgi:hypothetical protein
MANDFDKAVFPVNGVTTELHYDGDYRASGVDTTSVASVSEDLIIEGETCAIGEPLVHCSPQVSQQVLCVLHVAKAESLGKARQDLGALCYVRACAHLKVTSVANEALHIPSLLTGFITVDGTGRRARHGGHRGWLAVLMAEGLEELPSLGALFYEAGASFEVEMIRYTEVGVKLALGVVELGAE